MAARRRDSYSESESFSSSSSSASTDDSTVDEEIIGEIRPYNFKPRFMPNELENMNIEDTDEDVVDHRGSFIFSFVVTTVDMPIGLFLLASL